jgi:branched-chain amino acid aminotransferase
MAASGRLVFSNGKYIPESEAKISIFDSALMFGDMVFEMTRSFNGKQFKLEAHIERLFNGLKILRIPIQYSQEQLIQICHETVDKNKEFFLKSDEHRLMINVSRGPLSIYHQVFDNKVEPTVIVADFPLKWTVSGMGQLFDSGINAVIPSQRAIPAHLMDPKIKNRSRLFYQMANIEVSLFKGDNNWALLLDTDGNISEGTGDNFFIVKNDVIYSPRGRNILRGISRDYIFELCEELKLHFEEKDIEPYDVYTADEAFMTGTPFCMLPVTTLNSLAIGSGKKGPIFDKLLKRWSKNVGLDIEKQIKDFNSEMTSMGSGASPYKFSN